MVEVVLENELKEYKQIIIYGAGMVGRLVFGTIKAASCLEYLIGFAVSRKAEEQLYCGKNVYEIRELEMYKNTALVIVATLPQLHGEITKELCEYHFCNVICVDKKLYRAMEQQYIQNFVLTHTIRQKKIDILFMASDNNCSSGAFLCMCDLCAELKRYGISSLVVLPQYGNGEQALTEREVEFTYILSEHWAYFCRKPDWEEKNAALAENSHAVQQIAGLIDKYHVRLVHNNTTYTYAGALAAYQKGIPLVWHLRENIHMQGFEFVNTKYAMQILNQSDRIVAVSAYIKECMDQLDAQSVRIVYDGVDVKKYYLQRTVLQNAAKITIVLVGAIMPLKGQEEMLYAADILKQKELDFQILFVGGGEEEYIKKLQKIAADMCLTEKIQFSGRQDDVQFFYKKSDIAVVCSKSEAFGRTTVEAQMAGCLVIGADTGATPELIRDGVTGWLYQQGNYEELADKIIYAVKHPDQSRAMALTGQKYACATFTKERNAFEILRIYKEILHDNEPWAGRSDRVP